MEVDWHWNNKKFINEKENYYVLWRIWWTICTTRIKREIK